MVKDNELFCAICFVSMELVTAGYDSGREGDLCQ